jgi:hypothetical protein
MKRIMFVLLASIMLGSMFVFVKQTKAISNGMCLDPVNYVVNPPMDGSDLTFLWDLNISTSYAVSAWEAKLFWDPAVINCLEVTYGSFIASSNDATPIITTTSVMLGQNSKTSDTATGDGVLATIKFTFVLPGYSDVVFLESKVWDDALNEHNLLLEGTIDGSVSSERPHPVFSWTTADAKYGPLPTRTEKEGGRTTTVTGTTVIFNAGASYDVEDGTGSIANIVKFLWNYGDGKSDVYATAYGNRSTTASHVYTAYLKAGYLVNLTIWDNENEWWSTTWRFGGPAASDTVPMWRDVGIVDIWPSLPPYANWDELGDDWWDYWYFDSTDFYIPQTNDLYWQYHLSDHFCDNYYGYVLPTDDIRIENTPYPDGDHVKLGDSDLGRPLSYFNESEVFYDWDKNGQYSAGDSLVFDSDGDYFFNATAGDKVIYGPALTLGKILLPFDYGWNDAGEGAAELYYDADGSGCYTAGEPIYWDNDPLEEVSTAVNPTVREGLDGYGVGGLWILVTANNYGSVKETVKINLYALYIELDLKLAPPPPVQKAPAEVELVKSWTKDLTANAGTGWGLVANWLPSKNGTYIFFATIEAADSAVLHDGNTADNYFILSRPFCNEAVWDATSMSILGDKTFVQYMCDIDGDGKVGPSDFALLSSNYGAKPPKSP